MSVITRKASLLTKLQGFTAANRDATVTLKNIATGQEIERKPFLDGTLTVRNLDPGMYEMVVRHPNLIQPIESKRIRLFPQTRPTFVPVRVPADLFRDTPIRDIPDADLSPVQQQATNVRTNLEGLEGKAPGEVIRAEDWNTLVGAVSDLAGAVLELTELVSPQGHDHPEIAEKINEVQGNLQRFAEAFGKNVLELQRQLEAEQLEDSVSDFADRAGAGQSNQIRDKYRILLDGIKNNNQATTPVFTARLAHLGNQLLADIQDVAATKGDGADAFLADETVVAMQDVAMHYVDAGTQTKPESELNTYRRTNTALKGRKLGIIRGKKE